MPADMNKVEGELTNLRVAKYNGEKKPGDKPVETIVYDWPKGGKATRSVLDPDNNLLERVELSDEESALVKRSVK